MDPHMTSETNPPRSSPGGRAFGQPLPAAPNVQVPLSNEQMTSSSSSSSSLQHSSSSSSPTRLMTNLLSQFTVTSPLSSRWAQRRRHTDMADLIWHRPFLVDDCRTTVSLPDGDEGARMFVECRPLSGPYSISMGEKDEDKESKEHDTQQAKKQTNRTAAWSFCIECDDTYPFNAPTVTCLCPIALYHPNCVSTTTTNSTPSINSTPTSISTHPSGTYRIVLRALAEWSPNRRLSDVICWLQEMLLVPSSEGAPNSEVARTLQENPVLFRARVMHCWRESMLAASSDSSSSDSFFSSASSSHLSARPSRSSHAKRGRDDVQQKSDAVIEEHSFSRGSTNSTKWEPQLEGQAAW